MTLLYELTNSRQSGSLPITVPFNLLHLLAPLNLPVGHFVALWDKVRTRQDCPYQNCVSLMKPFVLDLQKAQNMTKLKQIVTLNNSGFTLIPDVEQNKPNVTCFAAQINNQAIVGQESIVMLVKLTLTKDGRDCLLELQAIRDSTGVCQTIADTLAGLIGK